MGEHELLIFLSYFLKDIERLYRGKNYRHIDTYCRARLNKTADEVEHVLQKHSLLSLREIAGDDGCE